jgi:hypothetical protein
MLRLNMSQGSAHKSTARDHKHLLNRAEKSFGDQSGKVM